MKKSLPFELRPDQRRVGVFLCQNRVISIGDSSYYALIDRFSHGIQVRDLVPMQVLATQDTRKDVRMRLAETGDIDVQAVSNIDPPGVDYVEAIAPDPFRVMWVHVEKICSVHVLVFKRGPGCGIRVERVVHMCGKVFQGGVGYLSVNVPIPGEHLGAVSQEGTLGGASRLRRIPCRSTTSRGVYHVQSMFLSPSRGTCPGMLVPCAPACLSCPHS